MRHTGKTVVVSVDPRDPDKDVISRAAKLIAGGGLVAFPTETVYGIAANRDDDKAMARLSRAKNRPGDKHYTVHIAAISTIRKMKCRIGGPALALMKKFWPGPLTLVLASKDGSTIGFRMPANKVALLLIARAKVPVVAPSANLSGSKPPTSAEGVMAELNGRIDMVIDSGPTDVGVESTVVDMAVKPYKILRAGAISKRSIDRVLQGRG